MKITLEHHEEKFTYESKYDSLDLRELTEKLYALCIAAGYHPDAIGECFYDKGQEATEHLYPGGAEHQDDCLEEYEPNEDESIVVKSRYGDERKFTILGMNCVEYSFEDDGHVGGSRDADGSLYSVDPSGGPFISIGTMLGNMHKDLEGLTVTKIKADEDKPGVYYLTVK
jgi:hypothetical protein